MDGRGKDGNFPAGIHIRNEFVIFRGVFFSGWIGGTLERERDPKMKMGFEFTIFFAFFIYLFIYFLRINLIEKPFPHKFVSDRVKS